MFLQASKALSALAEDGRLLPDLERITEVSVQVARAVAIEARDSGLGRQMSDDQYECVIRATQWQPHDYPFRASGTASTS